MSDLWAYCDPCARWFYPDTVSEIVRRSPPCPVCSTEALRVAEQPPAEGSRA